MILALALAAALTVDPIVCEGSQDATVPAGSSVTICWGMAPPADGFTLLYFRIRQSQSQSGAYQQLARINYDPTTMLVSVPDACDSTKLVSWIKVQYTFTPKFTGHYFVTAVYDVMENGSTVTKESVGSEHIRITVTK